MMTVPVARDAHPRGDDDHRPREWSSCGTGLVIMRDGSGHRVVRHLRNEGGHTRPPRQGEVSSATEQKRVTIHDVARSAGVSRQTVSRALNDKAEIDGGTKQRVLDAAQALGYRPSRFARGLVRQDTTSIGLVIPDLRNPF